MRDCLAPQYSPLASDASTTEMTGCTNKASVLPSLLAEMGKGNVGRTATMKERNAQNQEMLNIEKDKHAVRTEMDLSNLLLMYMQCLSDASQELKTLKRTEGYNSDSSETQEAKNDIRVLSERYNHTMRSLENHSA